MSKKAAKIIACVPFLYPPNRMELIFLNLISNGETTKEDITDEMQKCKKCGLIFLDNQKNCKKCKRKREDVAVNISIYDLLGE